VRTAAGARKGAVRTVQPFMSVIMPESVEVGRGWGGLKQVQAGSAAPSVPSGPASAGRCRRCAAELLV